MTLSFDGYFEETVYYSNEEVQRIRPVKILYHLIDDTITAYETSQNNGGGARVSESYQMAYRLNLDRKMQCKKVNNLAPYRGNHSKISSAKRNLEFLDRPKKNESTTSEFSAREHIPTSESAEKLGERDGTQLALDRPQPGHGRQLLRRHLPNCLLR